MARVHGKDSVFTLDSQNLSAYLDSVGFNDGVELAETTGLGDEAKKYIAGLKDTTISLSGRFDSTANGPEDVLQGALDGKVAVTFEYGPEGSANGNIKKSGSAFVTAYAQSSPVGDVVAFTAELTVDGGVTIGTYSA